MDLLANRSTISSKKVFRKKYNATRTIEKYKARMEVNFTSGRFRLPLNLFTCNQNEFFTNHVCNGN